MNLRDRLHRVYMGPGKMICVAYRIYFLVLFLRENINVENKKIKIEYKYGFN